MKAVEEFFVKGIGASAADDDDEDENANRNGNGEPGETEFRARLKEERLRWHPDKVQRRARGGRVDPGIMRDVTAVFQVVDRLWSEGGGRSK